MEIGGKLKFVGLELMKKNAKSTDSPEVGLFRGLRTRVEKDITLSLFLLGEEGKDDAIRGLNTEVFNIMTIVMGYDQSREMIVLKNNEADQKEGAEILDVIIEKLKEDKLMLESDPDIVDTSKYSSIPEDFFGAAKKPVNNNYNTGGGTGTPAWKKKQEEEKKEKERQDKLRWTPYMLKRKNEKPAIKDLNTIKKKVVMLANGEYKPELPETVEDEEDKKTSTTKK